MNILSGLFKSRDKPTNSLNGSGYRFFVGGTICHADDCCICLRKNSIGIHRMLAGTSLPI